MPPTMTTAVPSPARRVLAAALLASLLLGAAPAPAAEPVEPPAAAATDPARDPIFQALIDELVHRDRRLQNEARKRLAASGPEATPALVSRLRDPNDKLRWEIVTVFGRSLDPAALEPLARAVVEDRDPHVRWRSLWSILKHPAERRGPALEALREALKGGNGFMKWNAAVGLAALGKADGLELLHAGLGDSDSWRRWEAIKSLGEVHDESTPPRLGALLDSKLESERSEAVQSLGKIADEQSIGLLVRALEDRSPGVRARACRWLGVAGRAVAIPPLQALLKTESDPSVRKQAQSALEKLDVRP